jgi:hypothetical protein
MATAGEPEGGDGDGVDPKENEACLVERLPSIGKTPDMLDRPLECKGLSISSLLARDLRTSQDERWGHAGKATFSHIRSQFEGLPGHPCQSTLTSRLDKA